MKIPKNNLQASIVLPSILFIGIVVISCIFFPDRTDAVLSNVKEYIFSSFSWVYILCVAFFFLFLVILCLGKLGDIRLGNEDEKPEFSFFSWLCMLFSAGIGSSSNRLSTRLSRNCARNFCGMEFPSTSRAVTIVRRPAGN